MRLLSTHQLTALVDGFARWSLYSVDSGYIKLYRKTLQSPIWENSKVFRVWMWCLMKASYKKHTVIIGNQPVVLEPGQFVCGRDSAARETGLTPQNIRSCFQTLRLMENLTIKTTNKFSIITVLNWDTYQNQGENSTSNLTNNQPTDNQQITTNKKGKKGNNIYTPSFDDLLTHLKNQIEKCDDGIKAHREKIIEFFHYRMGKKKADQYKTEKGVNGLLRDCIKCQKKYASLKECLDITMERDWKTPDPDYFKGKIKEKPTLVY